MRRRRSTQIGIGARLRGTWRWSGRAGFARNRLVDDPRDPGIYLLALDRLAVPAEEAIVIEDSRNGLLAAVAAGLRSVVTRQ